MTLQISELTDSPFGARVSGIDPERISAVSDLRRIHQERLGLLCLEFDQLLSTEQLSALTTLFGDAEFAPGMITGYGKGDTKDGMPDDIESQVAAQRAQGRDPYLTLLGNVDAQGQQRDLDGSFYGDWEWHTDMSYIPLPPTFSLLNARQVPDSGGDTWFCNQILAARKLPEDLKQRVEGLTIKHDSTYGSSGALRPGMSPPSSPVTAIGHAHPILLEIPDGGEVALFLGRRTNAYIPGLELADSEVLLNELWRFATQPAFCYRHHWQAGEVVIWDNRMLMHRREPMHQEDSRLMWRTQTKGEALQSAG